MPLFEMFSEESIITYYEYLDILEFTILVSNKNHRNPHLEIEPLFIAHM